MQIVYRTRSRKPARVNAKIPPSDRSVARLAILLPDLAKLANYIPPPANSADRASLPSSQPF